jgi:hypothetical protein
MLTRGPTARLKTPKRLQAVSDHWIRGLAIGTDKRVVFDYSNAEIFGDVAKNLRVTVTFA